MAIGTYPDALAFVLAKEGGFVDHPRDPGGATNMGITLRVLQAWRGVPVSVDDVKNLTRTEASAIYRKQYWNAVRGDDLPAGIDLAVFDYAVNSGPSRAIRDLQRCVGATPDGVLGALTLAAIKARPARDIVNALCDRRLAFVRSLKTFGTFGRGWTARITAVREKSIAIAEGANPTALMWLDSSAGAGPGKADETDVSKWRTPEGQARLTRDVGAVGAAATTIGGLVQPYGDTWQWVGAAAVALLVIGALATVIVNRMSGPEVAETA